MSDPDVSELRDHIKFDWERGSRTGIPEVILAENKSVEQLAEIIRQCVANQYKALFTRVTTKQAACLCEQFGDQIRYHAVSNTMRLPPSVALSREETKIAAMPRIGIVAAGTSDLPIVAEIEQTLDYLGQSCTCYLDRGVAGLWRLLEDVDAFAQHDIIIAVAGMEGALFSVLAGLVAVPVIAVPTSVGYGVTKGGHVALHSALGSCTPGIAVVNIDNGFGAATLAVKMLKINSEAYLENSC